MIMAAKEIGLFEAKTKLSEICETVATTRRPIVITRRGRPLVRIDPLPDEHRAAGVWEARETHLAEGGKLTAQIELPPRRVDAPRELVD